MAAVKEEAINTNTIAAKFGVAEAIDAVVGTMVVAIEIVTRATIRIVEAANAPTFDSSEEELEEASITIAEDISTAAIGAVEGTVGHLEKFQVVEYP